MRTIVILVVILVVVLLAIALGIWVARRRHTAQLRGRFGDEYDRAVERTGSRREAEQALTQVAQRRDTITVRPLTGPQRDAWVQRWGAVQAQFVDAPAEAVAGARDLLPALMRERGYPVEDFEKNATLLAADHPVVVGEYRAAEEAYRRHAASGGSSTESLRQALVHYRALFDALVHGDDADPAGHPAGPEGARDAALDGAPAGSSSERATAADGAVRDTDVDSPTHGRHTADAPTDREVRR